MTGVRINHRLLVWSASLLALVAWTVVGSAAVVLLWTDLPANPDLFRGALFAVPALAVVGILVGLGRYLFFRLAPQADFTDQFRYRTLLRQRSVPWREVGRVVAQPSAPGWSLQVVLLDGTRLTIPARQTEAQAALDWVKGQPWASDARGWGLPRDFVLALIGLGALVLAVGVGLALAVVAAPPWQGSEAVDDPQIWLGAIAAAVVVPLLGLASLGLGGYHLLRRPVVTRPAVEVRPPGTPGDLKELLAGLFGRLE